MNDYNTTLSLAVKGDEEAFTSLVKEAYIKARGVLFAQFKLQTADVDDILQKVMLKAWNQIKTFRGSSTFSTWFCSIAKNEALDHLSSFNRRQKKEKLINDLIDQGDSASEQVDFLELNRALDVALAENSLSILERKEHIRAYRLILERVLGEISPIHSQIIRLVIQNEMPYKDIAKELGIPIGTVMSRLHFARRAAKQLILKYANEQSIQLSSLGNSS